MRIIKVIRYHFHAKILCNGWAFLKCSALWKTFKCACVISVVSFLDDSIKRHFFVDTLLVILFKGSPRYIQCII